MLTSTPGDRDVRTRVACAVTAAILFACAGGLWLVSQPRSKQTVLPSNRAENATEAVHRAAGAARRDADNDPDRNADASFGRDAEQYRRARRLSEDGTIPPNALMTAKAQRDAMIAAAADAPRLRDGGLFPSTWTWLGPSNIGGRIRSILFHPTNPNIMWVGSVSGGVWKTNNAGASWFALNDFVASLAVSCLAAHPSQPNTLYAGTGEGFAAGPPGAGIFRSTDGGTTWTQLPDTAGWQYVNRLTIAPDYAPQILAATSSGLYLTFTSGFAGWSSRWGGPVFDVDYNPGDSLEAVAGIDGGAIYSTDGGITWQRATMAEGHTYLAADSTPDGDDDPDQITVTSTDGFVAGLPVAVGNSPREVVDLVEVVDATHLRVGDLAAPHFSPNAPVEQRISGRVEVAYAPGAAYIVYASMNLKNGRLWRSLDGGHTYALLFTGTQPDYLAGQGEYNNALWVDPWNGNHIILGGIGIWHSFDGGLTLTEIGAGIHPDHHIVISPPNFNPFSNPVIYAGNDGGIFRANPYAAPGAGFWTPLNNNLGITQFYGAARNAASGVIVGGTQDNGTLRYTGSVSTWTTPFGGDGGFCAADPTDPSVFYGVYVRGRVFRSDDGGTSACYIHNPRGCVNANGDLGGACNMQPATCICPMGGTCVAGSDALSDALSGNANFIAPMALDPNNHNRLYVGARRLWRSSDAGGPAPHWTQINDDVSIAASAVSAVAVAPGNADIVWTGHNFGALYRSLNATLAAPDWLPTRDAAMPARQCSSIAIDSHNPDWVYVTFMGYAEGNMWKSKNGGVLWTRITGPGVPGDSRHLPAISVSSIALHPNQPGWLYVATDLGIFASEDDGGHWSTYNDGPANVEVDQLFFSGGATLYAATFGRGIYRATVPATVDCDGNGTSDFADVVANPALDCNTNTVPDSCDIANGYAMDCDTNGTPDECQFDCNTNGFADACEIATSLAHWWPADGDARDVRGAADGTPQGPVTYVSGFHGQAFHFDGATAEVSFPSSAAQFGMSAFTILFHLRTTSTRLESVVAKRPICSHGAFVSIRAYNGTLIAEIEGTQGIYTYGTLHGFRIINDGAFHAVALRRNGPYVELFVNGELDASTYTPFTADIVNTAPLRLAGTPCDGSGGYDDGMRPLTGDIDELQIETAALSNAQIRVRAAGPPQPDCNANGLPDACDIAAGAVDANSNGIPDACETAGDVDGDGDLDEQDAVAMVAVLLGAAVDPAQLARADLNHDGEVDGRDIQPLVDALLH